MRILSGEAVAGYRANDLRTHQVIYASISSVYMDRRGEYKLKVTELKVITQEYMNIY